MKDNEKLDKEKRLIFVLIIVFGIIDYFLFIKNVHRGLHFYFLLFAGLEETISGFVKKSQFKWCSFLFCCMYGVFILYNIL